MLSSDLNWGQSMYYSKPLTSYETVSQLLDQVASAEGQPVHWRKPLYEAIDELTEAAAPPEQVRTVEQLTIVMLKLDWAIQRAQTDKIEAAREQLARLDAEWRSMVEVDSETAAEIPLEAAFEPAPIFAAAPPRAIAQLQDLLADAGDDTDIETPETVAPPRWLSFQAPLDEAVAEQSAVMADAAEAEVEDDYLDIGHLAVTDDFAVEDAAAEDDMFVSPSCEEEVDKSWTPLNEGLPFGRPSAAPAVSGAETAPVAEPLGADPFSPPCEDLSGEDWSESRGSEPSHEREAAGFDSLASLQNSFAQSRIDFNDPYRDEEIESVAHALERITVRNRFC